MAQDNYNQAYCSFSGLATTTYAGPPGCLGQVQNSGKRANLMISNAPLLRPETTSKFLAEITVANTVIYVHLGKVLYNCIGKLTDSKPNALNNPRCAPFFQWRLKSPKGLVNKSSCQPQNHHEETQNHDPRSVCDRLLGGGGAALRRRQKKGLHQSVAGHTVHDNAGTSSGTV